MIAGLLLTLTVVLGLVLLNGLYVASEFAIIGSRRSQLELLAQAGSRPAARLLALITHLPALDRTIATLQVGITVVTIALGMYGEPALARFIAPWMQELGSASGVAAHVLASTLAVALLTFLHVVLGEVVPKSIALQNPVRAALWIEAPLRATRLVTLPLVVMVTAFSQATLALFGFDRAGKKERLPQLQEIEAIIEESGAGGALPAAQARLLARLVSFEDLLIRKVMVPRNRVVGLPVDAGWQQIRDMLLATKHSRYPVYRGDLDDIIGYVHVKDLMSALDTGRKIDLVSLARSITTLPETATCAPLLREFRRRRTHVAVAVDEHGGTAGIVTLEDLVEEIFGPVQDEFDAEEPPIHRLGERLAVALGTCRLDEINAGLGLALSDPQVDTVAGLIMKKLGRIARPGDTVRAGAVTLAVEEIDGVAVRKVRIVWTDAP